MRRGEEEAEADASNGKKESGGMASRINNLTIDTAEPYEEEVEGLEAALQIEVDRDGKGGGEV